MHQLVPLLEERVERLGLPGSPRSSHGTDSRMHRLVLLSRQKHFISRLRCNGIHTSTISRPSSRQRCPIRSRYDAAAAASTYLSAVLTEQRSEPTRTPSHRWSGSHLAWSASWTGPTTRAQRRRSASAQFRSGPSRTRLSPRATVWSSWAHPVAGERAAVPAFTDHPPHRALPGRLRQGRRGNHADLPVRAGRRPQSWKAASLVAEATWREAGRGGGEDEQQRREGPFQVWSGVGVPASWMEACVGCACRRW